MSRVVCGDAVDASKGLAEISKFFSAYHALQRFSVLFEHCQNFRMRPIFSELGRESTRFWYIDCEVEVFGLVIECQLIDGVPSCSGAALHRP